MTKIIRVLMTWICTDNHQLTSQSDILLNIDGPVATLVLNRPEVHHAVNVEMMRQWEMHLDTIDDHPDILVTILAASGESSFCAGGDIKYFSALDTREACIAMSERMQRLLERLFFGERFVIAAINGQALGGGCEIITACHYRIATEQASFAFRQAPNGLTTGWGGGRRLLRELRRADALRLLLTGERISVDEALRIGFVQEVVEQTGLSQRVRRMAQLIASQPRQAIRSFLALSNAHEQLQNASLAKIETAAFADLWMGADFREFVKKYLAKE